MWKRTFVGIIHAIPFQNNWPSFPDEELLQPPQVKRLPRRPHVHRKHETGEPSPKIVQSTTKKCSRCGKFGHNVRSCTGEAVKKAKGKGGKPVNHEGALRRQTLQALRGTVTMLLLYFVYTQMLLITLFLMTFLNYFSCIGCTSR